MYYVLLRSICHDLSPFARQPALLRARRILVIESRQPFTFTSSNLTGCLTLVRSLPLYIFSLFLLIFSAAIFHFFNLPLIIKCNSALLYRLPPKHLIHTFLLYLIEWSIGFEFFCNSKIHRRHADTYIQTGIKKIVILFETDGRHDCLHELSTTNIFYSLSLVGLQFQLESNFNFILLFTRFYEQLHW